VKRAEFDWKVVLSAVQGADLSDAMDERGFLKSNPHPAWPSKRYKELHQELESRIIAPPRITSRTFGITAEELEEAVDELFAELAVEAADPVSAERWEQAAAWLVEAKRRARETRWKA
jgi:hypothetical protein